MSKDFATPLLTNSALLGCFFVLQYVTWHRKKSLVGASREFAVCVVGASLLSMIAVLILAAAIKPEFSVLTGLVFTFAFFGAIFSMLVIPGLILIELGLLVEIGLLKVAVDIRTMHWHWVAFLVSACWPLSIAILRVSSQPNP
jgi:hypothetical protein